MSYLRLHAVYIILIVLGIVGFRLWLEQHDQRVLAEQQLKQSQLQVASLQQQIQQTQAAAQQKVAVIQRTVTAAKTPAQQMAAIPMLSDLPLNARPAVNLPDAVTVDLAPLVQELGACKSCQVQLAACQETVSLKDQQLAAKDKEVTALKARPPFWVRVKHIAEAVGAGVAIGFLARGKI